MTYKRRQTIEPKAAASGAQPAKPFASEELRGPREPLAEQKGLLFARLDERVSSSWTPHISPNVMAMRFFKRRAADSSLPEPQGVAVAESLPAPKPLPPPRSAPAAPRDGRPIRPDSAVEGEPGVDAPPIVVKLAGGQGIVLNVNTLHMDDRIAAKLAGRFEEFGDEEIERSVRALMFRDTESPYADSVRVTTVKGDLIGWIVRADADLACHVVDSVERALQGRFGSARGRPVLLNVSAKVFGEWDVEYESEDAESTPRAEASIENVEIRIKDPIDVDASSLS